jgi:hypothetical protein
MAQTIRAILLASAIAATFVGRRASKAVSHGRCSVDLGVTDDRKCAGHKQAAQITVTLLAYCRAVLASARGCFGTIPIQAEKLRPDRKNFGSATTATKAVAST